jgi:hypothetical protein
VYHDENDRGDVDDDEKTMRRRRSVPSSFGDVPPPVAPGYRRAVPHTPSPFGMTPMMTQDALPRDDEEDEASDAEDSSFLKTVIDEEEGEDDMMDDENDDDENEISIREDMDVHEGYTPSSKAKKTTRTSLLPLFNPIFNIREMCKEIVLLEDHLSHVQKRCDDCITKHFLKIEGLAEEAITLDKKNVLPSWFEKVAPKIRDLHTAYTDTPSQWKEIAQGLRNFRKRFQPVCAKIFSQGKKTTHTTRENYSQPQGCSSCQQAR